MNQNKLKLLYTAVIILGCCAFTPPRKCASPCNGSATEKECATGATTTDATTTDATPTDATAPGLSAGQKNTTAPDRSKELVPGRQAVTTEREEIPADSPFLVPLYV